MCASMNLSKDATPLPGPVHALVVVSFVSLLAVTVLELSQGHWALAGLAAFVATLQGLVLWRTRSSR
jgi:hypothetical protein